MESTPGLFQTQRKTKQKPTVPVEVGNQMYQPLRPNYKVQIEYGKPEEVYLDLEKNEVKFRDKTYAYNKIWVMSGDYAYIFIDTGNSYTLIGKYFYHFLTVDGENIVDFNYDDCGLYAVSSQNTYMLMQNPRWISNSRRTSYNPYQQWNELSEKKRKEGLIFLPLEIYHLTHF